MSTRVLETVLVGRDLLSPVLGKAGGSVAAFNAQVGAANTRAGASAAAGATVQTSASSRVVAANTRTAESATVSATTQSRAHARAAESASLSARAQQSASMAVTRANGLMGTSLTPLTAGLGATGLALGFAAFRGMEFGTAMSRVQASTQATGADMGRLREAAITMGADTQFSSVEAAAGITEMAKAGVSTANIIGGGLKGALDLAAAGEMEVADAAEVGATALNVFKLNGNQMAHVADLLAAGAGKAQGSVGDLGMALNQSALVASATGLSIEETTGTLAAFASAGLIGSDAGTSFRSMLLHLQNPSQEAAGVMADLGVNMYDANGAFVGMESLAGQLQTQMRGLTQAERDKAMATIFGSDAVRAANVLYEQGAQGIEEWTNKVNDAGYAARQATQLNDNLRGDLERLTGAVDSFFTNLGSGAQGPLREAVQMLTFLVSAGGDVLGFFNSLPGPVQAAVVGVAAFAALRGPMSGFLTAMHEKAVMGAVSLLDVAQSADKARAGLVGLTAAGAGLAAAFAFTKAIGEIVEFTQAGDDAQVMVDSLDDSLEGIEGPARLEANAVAIRQLRDELERYQAIVEAAAAQNWFDEWIWQNPFDDRSEVKDAQEAIDILQAKIKELLGETETDMPIIGAAVSAAMTAVTAQTEEAIKAQEDWLNQLQQVGAGFVEPLSVYHGLLEEKTTAEREAAEKTAAATEDATDSWKDHVGAVDVSLDEYAARLEEQNQAQENWRTNLVTVAQRGGVEVAQILHDMGPEAAGLVADMANATDAEFQRAAAAWIEDARFGSDGATKEMADGWLIAEATARAGSKATAYGISQELGIGLTEVSRLARLYGIELAGGINPLLSALNRPKIVFNQKAGVNYLGAFEREYDDGGYTGPGGRHDPAGIVHAGEVVWSQDDVAAHGGPQRVEAMRRSRQGYADGGFVTAADVPRPRSTAPYGPPISTAADATMQRGFDEVIAWLAANAEATQGGTAGGGAVGGAWMSLWNLVKGQIPAARINSTYRAGDPGYHGRNKAIDFGYGSGPGGAGSAGLASINRLLHDQVGRNLAELIYDGIGDDRPDLKNGRPLTYNKATQKQHTNHVHAAVRDQGGPVYPGLNLIWNGTGENEWVQPPTAMPGYGGGWGSGQQVVVVEKRTQVDVDARGFNADHIAAKTVQRLDQREWLTTS